METRQWRLLLMRENEFIGMLDIALELGNELWNLDGALTARRHDSSV